ncbi:hypothetical protein C1J05_09970 [Sulfitobacter sp. JL08]|uniref:hypothetical protein n=1 Tax=Sulfitobacter sp. JL08 TaxID=2070369 RepID=UPI000E0C994F|nr:hypothetical protein [Sulfitobacter sp. JL08]AXI54780.1 hypothetical protein C1J05_09970 [Sulfitobacter sp. JL08]
MALTKISAISSIILLVSAGQMHATDCEQWPQFSSTEDYLEPLSVKADEIGEHMNRWQWSDGVQFSTEMRGDELWLDILAFPGDSTAAAAGRAIMQTGRLASEDFDRLVLADKGVGIFSIEEPKLRAIGCQFIWGREGGQNPIALIRDMYKSMVHYPSGEPLSTAFNGSLFGDTNLAISLNNEMLIPNWVLSAVN